MILRARCALGRMTYPLNVKAAERVARGRWRKLSDIEMLATARVFLGGRAICTSSTRKWAAEPIVIVAMLACWAYGMMPFFSVSALGAGDAHWFRSLAFDTILSARHGIFPVYAGSTEYNLTGYPETVSIGYFNLFVLADLLTLRLLPLHLIYNATIAFFGLLYFILPYAALRYHAPGRPFLCGALAILFALSPSSFGFLYTHDECRPFVTTPFVVVIFAAALVMNERFSPSAAILVALCMAFEWMAYAPTGLMLSVLLPLVASIAMLQKPSAFKSLLLNYTICLAAFLALTTWYFSAMYAETIYNPYSGLAPDEAKLFFVSPRWVDELVSSNRLAIAALFPIDLPGNPQASVQLGYGLLFAVLATIVFWIYRPNRKEIAFVAVSALLVILIFPVPIMTKAIWSSAPRIFADMNFYVAYQKLYKFLTASIILMAATALARAPADRARSIAAIAGLWLFVPWTLWEHGKVLNYVLPSWKSFEDSKIAFRSDRYVTVYYDFSLFSNASDYITTHYDADLFERIIDERGDIIAGNGEEAAKTCTAGADHKGSFVPSPQCSEGSCRFNSGGTQVDYPLGAFQVPSNGRAIFRHRADFDVDPSTYDIHAVSIFQDDELYSQIWVLRQRGGLVMPVYNLSGHMSLFSVTLSVLPRKHPAIELSELCATPYDHEALPVHIVSSQPYVALTRGFHGAFLETRLNNLRFLQARVNGEPATIKPSPRNRAMVAVNDGANRIEVFYRAPPSLQAGFWFSTTAMTAAVVFLLRPFLTAVGWRRRKRAPAKDV
jgi:hypothetical protein